MRIYDANYDWKVIKDVTMINCYWTITDTAISHNKRFFLYSTLDKVAYKVFFHSLILAVPSREVPPLPFVWFWG